MKWIFPEKDKLISGQNYCLAMGAVRFSGIYDSSRDIFLGHRSEKIQRKHVMVLDESEPSFSLEDMRYVFNLFNNHLAIIANIRFGDNMFTEYLKDKFNINI